MSEAERYYIGVFGGEAQARVCLRGLAGMIRDSEGRHFTLAEDFDRVAAERDELQRQLDHKEQQRESELRNGKAGDRLVRELQQRLTAADQEIDDLRAELTTNPKPDSLLCRFYEVTDWPGLVRELVGHIAQLQDSAKRNVKPWEDTFPPTLLPAYIERVNADNATVQQPSPVAVVSDGYCIMPRQLTAENGAKALLLGEFKLLVTMECPECCELEEPTEGCFICDGEGEYGQKHTIPWDQIKFIYSKAVSGLAVKTDSAKPR